MSINNTKNMEIYEIPTALKDEIEKATTENRNKKQVFGAIALVFYPKIRYSALLIDDEKLELVNYK